MKCEICKKEPATSLSLFAFDDMPDKPHYEEHKLDPWKWAGACSADSEFYFIMLDDLKTQKDTDRWYHHLREKVWFGPVSESSFLTKLDDLQQRLSELVIRSPNPEHWPIDMYDEPDDFKTR